MGGAKQQVFKLLATALTGIGGHFLNKRWDKAVLFFCLFLLYGVFSNLFLSYTALHFVLPGTASPVPFLEKNTQILILAGMVLAGLAGLLISSIISTLRSAREYDWLQFTKWTKFGAAAALLSIVLCCFSFFYTIRSSLAFALFTIGNSPAGVELAPAAAREPERTGRPLDNFYEYLHFGGATADDEKLPPPPEGKGLLKGQITYQGEPAAGITLNIVLNSLYRAKNIVTDSEGVFALGLPEGTWSVNTIQTTGWPDRPKNGNFTVYHGGEEKLHQGGYNRFSLSRNGHAVQVTGQADAVHFNLSIRENLKIIWPAAEKTNASITDEIRWEKYPRASTYYVEIRELQREGATTHFDDVTSRVLSGESSLALASLKHVQTKDSQPKEYSVEIFAFAEDRTLVSEVGAFHENTFLLTDGALFIDDTMQALLGDLPGEDQEALEKRQETIHRNKRRSDAVEALIDDNLLPEAEKLLARITSDFPAGKKDLLHGYMSALQGDCAKANEKFEQALNANATICIEEKYKTLCADR